MVLALVLLPALSPACSADGEGNQTAAATILVADADRACARSRRFVAVMLIVGRRLIPKLVSNASPAPARASCSRLAVLAIALGVAFGAAALFGVSLALGAFFAGMMLNESEFSHQARRANRCRCAMRSRCCSSSPVGMLFDPGILLARAARGGRDLLSSSCSASRSRRI